MRGRLRHWTPRYAFNRIRWEIFERTHPDSPWLVPDAVRLLDQMLRKSDAGLEWGSGRSTVWFAKRLGRLTSVEDNSEWQQRVSWQLAAAGVKNVSYHMLASKADDPAQAPYVRIADEMEDESLGFALVDGSLREHCAHAVLTKIEPGGALVLDNSNWYLDHPTKAPYSRYGVGDENPEWKRLSTRLAEWRQINTSNGISDTTLWIRPARWVDPAPPPAASSAARLRTGEA